VEYTSLSTLIVLASHFKISLKTFRSVIHLLVFSKILLLYAFVKLFHHYNNEYLNSFALSQKELSVTTETDVN
jgi:hypothetical protein